MKAELLLAGERLELRADRSLFWPARRTLVVADLHFGKADAFRAASVPVPGNADATLDRLDAALRDTDADRLIVLGDFWHVREGRTARLLGELGRWRAARSRLNIELVRGNHDRAGDPPIEWADGWQTLVLVDPPFCFQHHPRTSIDGYVLAGHLHPGIDLAGRGNERFRLPCFWFSAGAGVLPAFGGMTGTAAITPAPGDGIFAIADGEIIPIPTPQPRPAA